MQCHPIPKHGRHLHLRLGELIGIGRDSHVYGVHVLNITSNSSIGSDSQDAQPQPDLNLPDLCIKLVEPDKPRSLAREAWFYEQLDKMGLQGVAAPRNYGLFTAHCPFSQVIPWRTEDWFFRQEGRDAASYEGIQFDRQCYEPEDDIPLYDDDHGSNVNSHWKTFLQDSESPIVSLMLLERLGETLQPESRKRPFCGEAIRQDIKDILEDISWSGFEHQDLRCNQFARSIHPTPCPRHGRAHEWHILDFQCIVRVSATDDDRKELKRISQRVVDLKYFWCLSLC
ncbi:hypothetical protein QCA50_020217 [Cerrena zonata]|uniref:Uncharacterized protein n=1 Tax=Cerrena zonata TaxID=2478898 RepID=A0AAW0F9I0_9APHY